MVRKIFIAHIDKDSKRVQSVAEHNNNVAKLCREFGKKLGLENTLYLTGYLHDMGKFTEKFKQYIKYSVSHPEDTSLKGKINHSTSGAKYIMDNFNDEGIIDKILKEIMALSICCHHGGLIDCIGLDGVDNFYNKINPRNEICYDESVQNFMKECLNDDELKSLFDKTKVEIKELFFKIQKQCMMSDENKGNVICYFYLCMLQKYIFSCVIDADRYDTYKFMSGDKFIETEINNTQFLWDRYCELIDKKINHFNKRTKIDILRGKISDACKEFSEIKPGIYQLAVPTGGGKTLSSLRYALWHAKKYKKEKIIYVIPFTTIIDQNVKVVRDMLEISVDEDIILEHHSNIVLNDDNEDDNNINEEKHKIYTERWTNPIIFTTMVQFMESIFGHGTIGIRRMHNLSNSIIIFDEIQSIPLKCISMFNSAMNFLSEQCGCTIILCTATQPLLDKVATKINLDEPKCIVSGAYSVFNEIKRTEVIDVTKVGGYELEDIKNFIIEQIYKVDSVLVIVNTKKMAEKVYKQLKEYNRELEDNEKFVLYHLSTNMCSTHRGNVLQKINDSLENQNIKFICISTQLIEAGVDISFQCVIRSIAGLDSIAQASGRCNRNAELNIGNTYIVNLNDENVDKLTDIKKAQESTYRVLNEFKNNTVVFDNDLLSPKAIEQYYKYYFYERKDEMDYSISVEGINTSIYDLLSINKEGIKAFNEEKNYYPEIPLMQAFKTASKYFNVIDQNTVGIIVPYEDGEELIKNINGQCTPEELKKYLKQAQRYSINMYDSELNQLIDNNAIVAINNETIYALKSEFYDEELGVTLYPNKKMSSLIW